MRELIFYTTAGCHLCEQAEAVICETLDFERVQVEVVDIAESDALVERYGTRIPVLAEGERELGWPFDHATLVGFMKTGEA